MDKNYNQYQVEDFCQDSDFISWVKEPTKETDEFWNNWMKNHQDKIPLINESRQIVNLLTGKEEVSKIKEDKAQVWTLINAKIKQEKKRNHSIKWLYPVVAASILILLVFITLNSSNHKIDRSSQWISYENNTGISQNLIMPDSSIVTLDPYSTLKYPQKFLAERIVFLEGEAFFDITRDTLKPFMVVANTTITKVLGTSFTITAFPGEDNVEVEVNHGKVAVYANVGSKEDSNEYLTFNNNTEVKVPKPNRKILITSNQKGIFSQREKTLVKSIISEPKKIIAESESNPLEFEEEPLVKVLDELSHIYGLSIELENTQIRNCRITTSFNSDSIFEELDIICDALNLNYEIDNSKIKIIGSGCP